MGSDRARPRRCPGEFSATWSYYEIGAKESAECNRTEDPATKSSTVKGSASSDHDLNQLFSGSKENDFKYDEAVPEGREED